MQMACRNGSQRRSSTLVRTAGRLLPPLRLTALIFLAQGFRLRIRPKAARGSALANSQFVPLICQMAKETTHAQAAPRASEAPSKPQKAREAQSIQPPSPD